MFSSENEEYSKERRKLYRKPKAGLDTESEVFPDATGMGKTWIVALCFCFSAGKSLRYLQTPKAAPYAMSIRNNNPVHS